jgi:hypothetical protein
MPTETFGEHRHAAQAPEQLPPSSEVEAEEALRVEATEQICRERRFRVHLAVITVVTPLVGLAWMLTEYYTAHTHHMWPSSFADAPADRPGVWSTWFFYFVGVMLLVIAIDAYRTYAKPYMQRRPAKDEIERKVARLKAR